MNPAGAPDQPQKGNRTMLAFQLLGLAFAVLFLAPIMTGGRRPAR